MTGHHANYAKALKILVDRVNAGEPLRCIDDDTIGDKSLSCSHGLCDEEADKLRRHHRDEKWVCPQDSRFVTADGERTSENPRHHFNGCYWKCHIFRGRSRDMDSVARRIRRVHDDAVKAGAQ